MNNFYSIIVGVGGDLNETLNDAESIYSLLTDEQKGRYNPENVTCLTSENSTKGKIISAFDELIKKTKDTDNSTVVIYYSGHGARYSNSGGESFDYYLMTHGYDLNRKEETMLNGNLFSNKIDAIKAERLLVLLDCCHAHGMKQKGVKTKGKINPSNRALQEILTSGKGRVFISSCEDNEESVILPDSKNSLFTQVVLEVLNGYTSPNNEFISALDLIYYVLNEVPKRYKKQTPLLTEASELSHSYYVCRNAKYKNKLNTINKSIEGITGRLLDKIDKGEVRNINIIDPKIHLNGTGELNKNDFIAMNNLFLEINSGAEVFSEPMKLKFFKQIGSTSNLKKIKDFFSQSKERSMIGFNNKSSTLLVETIDKAVDEHIKLEFIKNYKNKITNGID